MRTIFAIAAIAASLALGGCFHHTQEALVTDLPPPTRVHQINRMPVTARDFNPRSAPGAKPVRYVAVQSRVEEPGHAKPGLFASFPKNQFLSRNVNHASALSRQVRLR
jgi:hypothetical protein